MAHIVPSVHRTTVNRPRESADPDFLLQVARGRVAGWSIVKAFGRNDTIGTTPEDLWEAGGVMVWPTAAATISVASSDAADDITGTGLRSIEVIGLDANWDVISETVELDGTTPVVTANSYIRVNSVEGEDVGSNFFGVGSITGTLSGNTIFYIEPGDSVAHQSHYSVPRNHTGYIISTETWQGKDNSVDTALWHRAFGKAWHKMIHLLSYRIQVEVAMQYTEQLSEKSDVYMTSGKDEPAGGDVNVAGAYTLLLEDMG